MKPSKYELRSLSLRTLKGEVLDGDVDVEIPGISSFSHGTPPFEWISSYEVLYQHMIIPDTGGGAAEQFSLRTQGLHAFKIVDIRTAEISECFRKALRMELNGGSLETDPLTGRLRFNRDHMLDYLRNQIVSRLLPYSVQSAFDGGKTEIRSASSVIYAGNSMCLETCLSASGRCFSYVLRPEGTDVSDEIYAIFGANSEPLKVAHGGYAVTNPVGWIE
jgi:hypothetical protein